MSHNLAARSREERDRVNVDLAASGAAYKERMNLPVIPAEVERQQPEEMREYSGSVCNSIGKKRRSSRAVLTRFIRRRSRNDDAD